MKKERRLHYAWWILLGCCMIQLMTLGTIVNAGGIYYLDIVKDFNARGQMIGISDLSWFYTAISVAIVVGLSFVNQLLERFPLRLLMTVSLLVMAGAQGAMAFYDHAPLWGVSGFLVGIAAPVLGIVSPTVMLMNWFQEKQGTVLALQSAFGSIGGAIMNPLIQYLIQHLGWRMTYLLTAGLIALLVLPFTLFIFRLRPEELGWRPYGFQEEAVEGPSASTPVRELPGLTAQAAREKAPYWLLMLAMLCVGFLLSFVQFLKPYAATVRWEALGAVMTSLALIGSLGGGMVIGTFADRFRVERVYRVGAVAVALGLLLLIMGAGSRFLLLAGSFLYGIIQGLSMVSTPLLVRKAFGVRDYATIFARLYRVQFLTSAVSYYAITRLAELFGSIAQPNYAPLLMIGLGLSLLLTMVVPLAIRKGQ